MSFAPTVLYPLTLPGLLNYVCKSQSSTAATVLVVCSSRDAFLQDLSESLQQEDKESEVEGLGPLVAPTLYNLFTTRHVQLAFCPSVQALLAYLTAYVSIRDRNLSDTNARERLVLVNLLALHAPTPAFSAQGLSRVFATAAEFPLKTGVMLQVVECQGIRRVSGAQAQEDIEMEIGHEENHSELEDNDPWEQEVSILNVSARRFGSGSSERAWAGRTVKAKRIAGRWFHFLKLDES